MKVNVILTFTFATFTFQKKKSAHPCLKEREKKEKKKKIYSHREKNYKKKLYGQLEKNLQIISDKPTKLSAINMSYIIHLFKLTT